MSFSNKLVADMRLGKDITAEERTSIGVIAPTTVANELKGKLTTTPYNLF